MPEVITKRYMSFNRTFMELKFNRMHSAIFKIKRFNRTFMELK